MKRIGNTRQRVVLLAFLIAVFSNISALAAEVEIPVAANLDLDPNAFVDELGLPGVVPVSHPGRLYPATDDFPTGPEIGELFPNFSLRNQHGELVNFRQSSQGTKVILDFFRSVVW